MRIISFFVLGFFIQTLFAQKVLPYKKGDLWGLVDKNVLSRGVVQWVAPPSFELIIPFPCFDPVRDSIVKYTWAFQMRDEKGFWMLIDEYGIKKREYRGSLLTEESILFERGYWHFLPPGNKKHIIMSSFSGEIIPHIPSPNENTKEPHLAYHSDLGVVYHIGGKKVGEDYIGGRWKVGDVTFSKKVTAIFPFSYSSQTLFCENGRWTKILDSYYILNGGKYGFMDNTGKIVVPAKYLDALEVIRDTAFVKSAEHEWKLFDIKDGEKIILPFDRIERIGLDNNLLIAVKNGKYKLYNLQKGEASSDSIYDEIKNWGNALVIRQNNRLGIYNPWEQKWVHPPIFRWVGPVDYVNGVGMAMVDMNNRIGVLFSDGQKLLDPIYDAIMINPWNCGLIKVLNQKKVQYFDPSIGKFLQE